MDVSVEEGDQSYCENEIKSRVFSPFFFIFFHSQYEGNMERIGEVLIA